MFQDPNAFQIRVTLASIEPAIWRRLVVPTTWHLGQLHRAIQAAFGWWDYHLHEFNIGGLRYGDPDLDDGTFPDDARTFDEREVLLRDFDHTPGLTFAYHYDFGDSWMHHVAFETVLALDTVPRSALCIDGARARPPEDVGGIGGYERFLATMADPTDPDHHETRVWCGGHFDPEWFDLDRINRDLKNALKPNVRRPLHQPKPKRQKPSP